MADQDPTTARINRFFGKDAEAQNEPQVSVAVRILRTIPFVLVIAIQACIYFVTVFVVLLPLALPEYSVAGKQASGRWEADERIRGVILLVIYHLLFALATVSFFRAAFTPPGEIPSWLWSDGRSDLHSYSNLLQAVERKRDGSVRFCRKCSAYKPDRAHHCKEVGKCVLQYQHYSWVLNTAIGFYNYKFYLLMLFYGALAGVFVLVVTAPEVAQLIMHLQVVFSKEYLLQVLSLHSGAEAVQLSIGLSMIMSAVLVVGCTVPLCFHLYLISKGLTAHEFWQYREGKKDSNPFDYGPVTNMALVFGIHILLWLVPTAIGQEGNGIFFPQSPSES